MKNGESDSKRIYSLFSILYSLFFIQKALAHELLSLKPTADVLALLLGEYASIPTR